MMSLFYFSDGPGGAPATPGSPPATRFADTAVRKTVGGGGHKNFRKKKIAKKFWPKKFWPKKTSPKNFGRKIFGRKKFAETKMVAGKAAERLCWC